MTPTPLNYDLAAALWLITLPLIARTQRLALSLLMAWSLIPGTMFLLSDWQSSYAAPTVALTVALQALATAEAAYGLASYKRSRTESALILSFSILVGLSMVLAFGSSNPDPYQQWNPAMYFTRTAAHIFLVGMLAAGIVYHFSGYGGWHPVAAHAALMFCYLFVNVVSHALKDPALWASRNGLQLGVHIGCVAGWLLISREKLVDAPLQTVYGITRPIG